jgi:ribosomal-protein-alanine N-acetyltransferase
MTIIETRRLLLRELTDTDHEALYEMYLDPRMNRFIGGPPPPRPEYWRNVRGTWPAYYARHGFGLWATVRKEDGRLIGRCGLLEQEIDEGERHVEVGYALGTEFWGRGYATEAARACRDHAFRTLQVPHVISLILPDNAASIRVAEKNGMAFWKVAAVKSYLACVYRITRAKWERSMRTGGG